MHLSAEKDLSPVAAVTGKVRKILTRLSTLVNIENASGSVAGMLARVWTLVTSVAVSGQLLTRSGGIIMSLQPLQVQVLYIQFLYLRGYQ